MKNISSIHLISQKIANVTFLIHSPWMIMTIPIPPGADSCSHRFQHPELGPSLSLVSTLIHVFNLNVVCSDHATSSPSDPLPLCLVPLPLHFTSPVIKVDLIKRQQQQQQEEEKKANLYLHSLYSNSLILWHLQRARRGAPAACYPFPSLKC